MKKIIAALIVFAMIAFMVPTVCASAESSNPSAIIPVQSGTESVTDTGAVEFVYTPEADGVLSVTLSGDPGYKIWVYRVADGGSVGLSKRGAAEATYAYELVGGVAYRVHITGYHNWGTAAATITYAASFEAKVTELAPVAIDKSDVVLTLGANTVDLLENTIVSLYDFVPAESGVYTITVGGNVTVATYGFAAWNKIADAENGVVDHTATAANQTFMIGLTADTPSVTVTIEKTGDYAEIVQNEYANYEPECPVISDFEDPSDLVSIDLNKAHNVVLGNDGYYHLGTADGPVIFVNLNNEQFTLSVLYDAGAPITMRGIYTDENGVRHYYDFMAMITDNYYQYSKGNDYHPLNKDLMIFLKAYGKSQGWYKTNTSGFQVIRSGEFLEESAWLASCYSTVSGVEVPGGDTPGGNIPGGNTPGGNTPGGDSDGGDTPDDAGDVGFMGAVITMVISAICGTAVVVKKKEF